MERRQFEEALKFAIGKEQEAADAYGTASETVKREEAAHNLYTVLASNTNEAELRSFFEMLASEEAKHRLALEKEYDENVLSEN
ncbi:MAG: hypothetical protein GF400_04840 [Candidatus Eisenbacteria bacterium]|nr:hypothetical protein [Candidatus Eisenbacteria bacterium]